MKIRWFFVFSVVSGFCSLVYEVVWLRLSMAAFGVTTPMVSVVLSVFMAGLALGSWGAGRLSRRLDAGKALRLYALSEIVIGVSGLTVPLELRAGRILLTRFAGEVSWASSAHYLAAGVWVAVVLLPFCIAMGATLPLMMAAIRQWQSDFSARSFSYLYLGNVIGAASGTLVSAVFLVELLGFQGTLLITAVLNGVLALFALRLARSAASSGFAVGALRAGADRSVSQGPRDSVAPVSNRLGVHGDGSRLGPPVHAVSGHRGLRLRHDSRPLPRRDVSRFPRLSQVGRVTASRQ